MDKDCEIFKMMNGLLEDKLDLLNQIYDLTILQYEKIEEDSIEKLLSLINSKQIRIEKIKNIDTRYSDILEKNFGKKLCQLNLKDNLILRLKDKEDKTKELAAKIYEIEQNNKHILIKKMDEVKRQLKGCKTGKKVTSGYYKIPTQAGGYFIDKKS
ncbi:hypothetical protein [Paramaledivibacter caminithermalis]|jgi:hypothetical protein|uniref:FlgN protein n=1 Tax=Paramaledivibacter caminithermalis (strain DSM 15212 / CIP 107654 / DViRD3) TaxID=1121301 RepID=A0A1M6L7D4_PARC5|nr:hypothetical protein [Paramaledivibacter caminithermalis]SHJ67158.1 hypothetical protein SAMN02745912_00701 [Paramaledivibacter caminithermalis DSM 15212]